jgi:hypothetical protein
MEVPLVAAVLVPVPDPVTETVASVLATMAVRSHALRASTCPYSYGDRHLCGQSVKLSVSGWAGKLAMLVAYLGDWAIEHDRD